MNKITEWKIIFVDENKLNIKYSGVTNKGRRPYLVIKTHLSQGVFLAVPLTDIYNSNNSLKEEKEFWVKVKFRKESYIKLDHITIFDFFNSDEAITIVENWNLPKNLKQKCKRIIKSIFVWKN